MVVTFMVTVLLFATRPNLSKLIMGVGANANAMQLVVTMFIAIVGTSFIGEGHFVLISSMLLMIPPSAVFIAMFKPTTRAPMPIVVIVPVTPEDVPAMLA